MVRILTVFFIILLASGCKNRLEKYGEPFSGLMKSSNGIFRGVHLGDPPVIILQEEGIAPDEESKGVITYEVRVGSTGTCTIRYGFENNCLYEIIADATFDDLKEGKEMLNGFKDYYTALYGPFVEEGGYLVWSVQTPGPDHGATIEMSSEGDFLDMEHWSMSIYRHSVQEISVPADSLLNL